MSDRRAIAEVLKTLGHPLRLQILQLIRNSKTNELSVKQIHESLDIPQPEASKHLIVMKNRSILLSERKNGHSYYRLNKAHAFIKGILDHLKN